MNRNGAPSGAAIVWVIEVIICCYLGLKVASGGL